MTFWHISESVVGFHQTLPNIREKLFYSAFLFWRFTRWHITPRGAAFSGCADIHLSGCVHCPRVYSSALPFEYSRLSCHDRCQCLSPFLTQGVLQMVIAGKQMKERLLDVIALLRNYSGGQKGIQLDDGEGGALL